MHIALYKLNSTASAEVRAADADNDENIAVLSDPSGSILYSCVLVLVVVNGAGVPAEKIRSRARSALNGLKSCLDLGGDLFDRVRVHKIFYEFFI